MTTNGPISTKDLVDAGHQHPTQGTRHETPTKPKPSKSGKGK